MTHELKTEKEHFRNVVKHAKRFEIRKDDRGFKVWDKLRLRETENGVYTGSFFDVQVTHILRNVPEYGLMEGYCIMSIVPI